MWLVLKLAEIDASIALDILVDPVELSGRQSGTVTTVLNVRHFMKIAPDTAIPLYMLLQNGSLVS